MATMLNQAKLKVLNARKNATGVMQITHFKLGNAPTYVVDPAQTDLVSPILIGSSYTKAIDSATISNNVLTIRCKLLVTECVDKQITELGLVDSAGDVVCIKTFTAKEKTADREMVFKIEDFFEEEVE